MSSIPSPVPAPGSRGTALHRQIFLVLRDEIARGMAPGSALPNEEQLCQRFGVSRITVRRALADLAAQGLVERRHGRGTFVLGSGLEAARPQPSLSLIESLRRTAIETVVQVIQVEEAAPPASVARLLQLPPGEKAKHALRLRLNRRGEPAMLNDTWVPAALGRRATEAALKKQALYQILMSQGVQFGRVVQEITATVSDPQRAAWLRTDVGAPLLKLERLMHDIEDRPVLHLTTHMQAERASILMEVAAASVNTLTAGQVLIDAPVRQA